MRGRRLRRRLADLDVVHFPLTVMIPAFRRRLRSRPCSTCSTSSSRSSSHARSSRTDGRSTAGRSGRASSSSRSREHAARAVIERYALPESRVRPIHLGLDHEVFRPGDEAREPFLVYPARAWPHKNHDRLFAAFAELRRSVIPTSSSCSRRTRARRLQACARSDTCHATSSSVSTGPLPVSSSRACTKDSASRRSRRWPAVVRLRARTPLRYRRCAATAARLFDPTSVEAMVDAVEEILARPDEWRQHGVCAARLQLLMGPHCPCTRRRVRGGRGMTAVVTFTAMTRVSPSDCARHHRGSTAPATSTGASPGRRSSGSRDELREGMATLETGSGASTIVFAAAGTEHVAVTPDPDEEARIRAACRELGVSSERVSFEIGFSHDVLPRLPTASTRSRSPRWRARLPLSDPRLVAPSLRR